MGLRLRVIDIETTGEAPPAEIIEFGRVDVVRAGGRLGGGTADGAALPPAGYHPA